MSDEFEINKKIISQDEQRRVAGRSCGEPAMSTHDNQHNESTGHKIESPAVTAMQQIAMLKNAVRAVLDNYSQVDASKTATAILERGQLGVLQDALKDYPEPVTEEVWDNLFKANISDLLADAKINGSPRYANPSSRDVMTNLFKVATMGLTLAKHDRQFEPSLSTSANLKKYAADVRPKLQAAIDPETGKPRLRSIAIAVKGPKNLRGDTFYWLFGCESDEAEPGMTLLKRTHYYSEVERSLREEHWDRQFNNFFYCVAKMEPMPVEEHEIVIKTLVTTTNLEGA